MYWVCLTGTLHLSVPSVSTRSVWLQRPRRRMCCCVICLDTGHHVHVLHLSPFVLHWSFFFLFKAPFLVPFLSRTQVVIFSPLGIFVFFLADVIKPDHPKPISGSSRPFNSWEHSCQPPLRRSQPPGCHPSFSLSSLVHLSHPASSPLFCSSAITPRPLRSPTPPTCISSIPLASTLVELQALSWLMVTEGDADPNVFSPETVGCTLSHPFQRSWASVWHSSHSLAFRQANHLGYIKRLNCIHAIRCSSIHLHYCMGAL